MAVSVTELVDRAVEAAVDTALGEVHRQCGDLHPTLKEARSMGINYGQLFVREMGRVMSKHDKQVQALAGAQMALRIAADAVVTAGDQLRQVEALPAGVNAAEDVRRKAMESLRDLNTRVGNLLIEVTAELVSATPGDPAERSTANAVSAGSGRP